jgi:hypothetical protein
MSKGSVWNKGKHNGRGLPAKKQVQDNTAGPADSNAEDSASPINSVKRMNRENWVVRPERVVNKAPKNDGNKG